ncbi:OmpA family protein [Pyxidicoccus fallax]|uniref:OmpA family protein n=1 Tax=Pyxidicoccus fallax TaxID=394095 RepID=A0A848LM24_9BACT|nr:OmpA family protein [Pyxidicoccus fallax]NMO18644.1 OmpA family protein [Pyxidicoccus fallax]NPC79049.1 OmpA family protein [Pyxidicoccus fallax]
MHFSTLLRGLAVVALLRGSTAWSQTAASGFELERLELNTGQGSLLVGNGELLAPGGLSVGLVGHYQHLPLMLQNGEHQLARVSHRASVVLAGSYGVLPWLEVGAQVPSVLWQTGGDPGGMGLPPLVRRGLGTPVLQARLGLLSLHREQPMDLAVDLAAGLPVGSEPALARDAGMRFRARATAGVRWGWLHPAFEAGVLLRPSNGSFDSGPTRLIPELRLGAVVAMARKGLRAELAVRGAFSSDYAQPSLEMMGGVRLPLTSRWELFAMGGPGLGNAPGTPTARVLLGLSFRMEPPPGLERLSEAIPRFRLEQVDVAPRVEEPRLSVEPVPTRELLPAEAPLASAAPLLQGSVLFEPGRAELSGDLGLLQAVVVLLRTLPGEPVIHLVGHAGHAPEETTDGLLPLRRALAVQGYLTAQGVPASRLRVRSASPGGSGSEDPGHARRVEVRVAGQASSLAGETP